MSNKILTSEEVTEIEARLKIVYAKWHEPLFTKRLLDGDIPALCATVRQLLEENERLKDELQCEFCDEPVYDEQGNVLTFLVCGRCWNKSQEQLATVQQLLSENEKLKDRDRVCWHCGDVLAVAVSRAANAVPKNVMR